jgi:hypothetical protein
MTARQLEINLKKWFSAEHTLIITHIFSQINTVAGIRYLFVENIFSQPEKPCNTLAEYMDGAFETTQGSLFLDHLKGAENIKNERSFVFNRLLNCLFKHSFSFIHVENVENSVDNRSCAEIFKPAALEKDFYSFYCGYFRTGLYTISLYPMKNKKIYIIHISAREKTT